MELICLHGNMLSTLSRICLAADFVMCDKFFCSVIYQCLSAVCNNEMVLLTLLVYSKSKGKAIPVTDRGGPWGCETSRLRNFYIIGSQMAVSLSLLRVGRPLPPGRFLVLISVRSWVDPKAIVRLEGISQLKNPLTSTAIESATFRLVA
jgi:hypothetical protein